MKKIIFGLCVCIALSLALLGAPGGGAKTVKLAWDNSTETDLAGYGVYWGIIGSGITNVSSAATNTITISQLANGQYWFGVTAKNKTGQESDFSNIVTCSIPKPPNNLTLQ